MPRLVRQGGNPRLAPETGRAWQLGATWSPRAAVAGELKFEASWFRYEFTNLITGVGPTYVQEQELGGLGRLVHRAPGTETYLNRTNAPIAVLTGANATFTPVAPGQSATVPGRITRVDVFTINLSRRQLEGWDFGVRQSGRFAGGRWTAAANATYTHKIASAYDQHSPLVDYAGYGSSPRWRGRILVDWTRGAWSTGATMAYISSSGHHTAEGRYTKPYRTVNLRAAYTTPRESWLRGTQFTVGLDDIFDEEPALFLDHPIGFQYGTVARPQGRFWRVSAKRTW